MKTLLMDIDLSNPIIGIVIAGIIITSIIIYIIIAARKHDNIMKYNKMIEDYNNSNIAIDKLFKIVKAEKNFPESGMLLPEIINLNSMRLTTTEPSKEELKKYKTLYKSFIDANISTIKELNRKKNELDNAIIVYNKYNKPEWRGKNIEIINNLVKALNCMLFTKGSKYDEDIKELNTIISSVMEGLSNLNKALDAREINSISGLISNMDGLEKTFNNIKKKLEDIIIEDVTKVEVARGAKKYFESSVNSLIAYADKEGVSDTAKENTLRYCRTMLNRLSEFNGLDVTEVYSLYELLLPQLEKCKEAKNESEAYEAEVKRQIEEERRRKQQEEEDDYIELSLDTSFYVDTSNSDDNDN